ncbi:MAG: polysaccharide deacetylase family protein [Alphaproteobacteria bacterium]|jgi:allantoinase|nr:polysaccharide deacetylase family protein [Alphaproteobacteria bacterium]MBT4017532.1 polysaccharide deacetylase family protein [Alphaproteobacteria bacterium]MBT4964687.1 polysaccharide deacetylase family protein [Alphaproteobacteria bacterium]MBT5161138.1 polysaccharide deacetylase family protein [Alphaproteobacteria bacterium]
MTDFTLPDGKRLALSIVINVEEGSEMNVADGDKLPEPVDELGVALKIPIRNYVNESNYQYGIRAGGPRVMKLLDKYEAKTTVTAAALSLERAPDLAAEIKRQGHEVCSHGWRWVHQFSYKEDREREFIRKAAESIEKTMGTRPAGWLSRYLHTAQTHRLLLEEGYTYHMDDMSDDVPRWKSVEMADGSKRGLVVMPYAIDTNDMKFWVAPAYTPTQWLDYVRHSVDWMLEETKEGPRMLSVGLHLRIIGRPGRIWALDEFLKYVSQIPEIWITSRQEIAERFVSENPWSESQE